MQYSALDCAGDLRAGWTSGPASVCDLVGLLKAILAVHLDERRGNINTSSIEQEMGNVSRRQRFSFAGPAGSPSAKSRRSGATLRGASGASAIPRYGISTNE